MKINIFTAIILISTFLNLINIADAKNNTFNVTFAKGELSTVIKRAVIRGDRDAYMFGAMEGQRLSLAITSIEDNAVFEFYSRNNGKWNLIKKSKEKKSWNIKLPKSEKNQYMIQVGGTRGNATYELFVGISVVQ